MSNSERYEAVSPIENAVAYRFKNRSLLTEALTHSSYSHENNLNYNYERLEFLGDAVLELIVSEYILIRYTDMNEGSMSRLRAYVVNEKFLSATAGSIGLEKCVFLGKGEAASFERSGDSILADIFEAFIAAIYLDAGYVAARRVALSVMETGIKEAAYGKVYFDEKGEVQKLSQKLYGLLPEYKVLSETGPDHQKIFMVELSIGNMPVVIGTGRSKKEAEKNAAAAALKKLEENG